MPGNPGPPAAALDPHHYYHMISHPIHGAHTFLHPVVGTIPRPLPLHDVPDADPHSRGGSASSSPIAIPRRPPTWHPAAAVPPAHERESDAEKGDERICDRDPDEAAQEDDNDRSAGDGGESACASHVPSFSSTTRCVPPHIIMEEQRAASMSYGGSAFSLCQGVGRTLKGRDLRQVRNAILKQTGFI